MRTNLALAYQAPKTHEGAPAARITPYKELRRSVLTCLLWESSFYEPGSFIAQRIEELCRVVEPGLIALLAVEAREQMKLRHVPLFLVRQLARRSKEPGIGTLVAVTLERVIQRADELSEYCALYWKDAITAKDPRSGQLRRVGEPLSAASKRGLAAAFQKFSAFELAKYNRDGAIKLKDVLFLCHAKPKDHAQYVAFKQLIDGTLPIPETWETLLSAGSDKKATFEHLLRENKLGGLALLRNLRNMQQSGVDEGLIRERLEKGASKALPFRFITAARYAPSLEPYLEIAMFRGLEGMPQLPGKTGLLIDVSGSMDVALSSKSETTRLDAACGLAVIAREKCEQAVVATFSNSLVNVPPRRGFVLRDAVLKSQSHGGTELGAALKAMSRLPGWSDITRLIVITDEQSYDHVEVAWEGKAYLINVATEKNGVGYGNGWVHLDGWSESVVDYIRVYEEELYQ